MVTKTFFAPLYFAGEDRRRDDGDTVRDRRAGAAAPLMQIDANVAGDPDKGRRIYGVVISGSVEVNVVATSGVDAVISRLQRRR